MNYSNSFHVAAEAQRHLENVVLIGPINDDEDVDVDVDDNEGGAFDAFEFRKLKKCEIE